MSVDPDAAEGRMPPRCFLLILLVALAARLIHLVQAGAAPEFGVPWLDQRFYHDQAVAMISDGEVSLSGFRSLLYSGMVSLVYRVFGQDPVVVIWLQSLLGVVSALVCAAAAWKMSGKPAAAIVTGLLAALNPVALVFECGLLTATPSFLALAVFSLALAHLGTDAPRRGWLLTAGAMPALLLHLTPQLAPVLLAPLLLVRARRVKEQGAGSGERGARWRGVGWIGGGFVVLLLLLAGYHAWVGYTTGLVPRGSSGINAWLGNHRGADGIFPRQPRAVSYQGGYQDPMELLTLQEARRLSGNPDLRMREVSAFWRAETFREVRAAPGRWCGLMLKKAWVAVWNAEPPNVMNPGFWGRHVAPTVGALPGLWGLSLLLIPLALWRADRRAWGIALAVALGLAGMAVFFVNSRYRVPLFAPLSVLAGLGAANLRAVWAARDWKPLGASALLGLASFINWGRVPPFPEYPDWMARGEACLIRGRPEDAASAYETAVRQQPGDLGGWFGLGNARFAQGKWPDAITAYDGALRLDSAHPFVQHNRARALDRLGDAAAALAGYAEALRLVPENTLAAGQMAMLLIRQGRTTEARVLLERKRPGALGRAPEEEAARAWLLEAGGDPAQAESIRATLRAAFPGQMEELFRELPPAPSSR